MMITMIFIITTIIMRLHAFALPLLARLVVRLPFCTALAWPMGPANHFQNSCDRTCCRPEDFNMQGCPTGFCAALSPLHLEEVWAEFSHVLPCRLKQSSH